MPKNFYCVAVSPLGYLYFYSKDKLLKSNNKCKFVCCMSSILTGDKVCEC